MHLCVQEALAAHEAQSSDVAAERAALRADLEKLLRERGTLDSLKRVVSAALKAQQVGPACMMPVFDAAGRRIAQSRLCAQTDALLYMCCLLKEGICQANTTRGSLVTVRCDTGLPWQDQLRMHESHNVCKKVHDDLLLVARLQGMMTCDPLR